MPEITPKDPDTYVLHHIHHGRSRRMRMTKKEFDDRTISSFYKVVDESGLICTFDNQGTPIMTKKTARSYLKAIMDVFLPAGYPHSVTPDYTPYQVYVCC